MQSAPKKDYDDMHSKSISSLPYPNTKWKLSNVKSLNAKALDSHLDNLKLAGHSIQDVILLHSSVALLMCVGTDGIVEMPQLDGIDESISHRRFLVPQNSASEHHTCE